MRRTKQAMIIAIVGSLAAHAAFVVYSNFCYLRGMGNVMDETRKIFRLGKIENIPAVVQLKGDTSKASIPTIKMTHQVVGEGAPDENIMAVSEPDKKTTLEKKTSMMESNRMFHDIT